MKKIIVLDLPENVSEVSVSYANLLGARFVGRVKAHSLPQPKDAACESFIDASIQVCQNAGWNSCLDAIKNLSE